MACTAHLWPGGSSSKVANADPEAGARRLVTEQRKAGSGFSPTPLRGVFLPPDNPPSPFWGL